MKTFARLSLLNLLFAASLFSLASCQRELDEITPQQTKTKTVSQVVQDADSEGSIPPTPVIKR
jgi:hypothetical protein